MGSSYMGFKKTKYRSKHSSRQRSQKFWLTDESNYSDASPTDTKVHSSSDDALTASRNTYDSNTYESDTVNGSSGGDRSGEEALQRLADYVGRIANDSPSHVSSPTTQGSHVLKDPAKLNEDNSSSQRRSIV